MSLEIMTNLWTAWRSDSSTRLRVPRTLFVTADGDVYKSMNDGGSWSKVSTGLNCQYTLVDRTYTNYIYAGGDGGFYRSTNCGSAWIKVGLTEMVSVYDIKAK